MCVRCNVRTPSPAPCGWGRKGPISVRLVRHDPPASRADEPMHTPGETCAAPQRHDWRETPYERRRIGLLLVDSANDFLTFRASEGTLIAL